MPLAVKFCFNAGHNTNVKIFYRLQLTKVKKRCPSGQESHSHVCRDVQTKEDYCRRSALLTRIEVSHACTIGTPSNESDLTCFARDCIIEKSFWLPFRALDEEQGTASRNVRAMTTNSLGKSRDC